MQEILVVRKRIGRSFLGLPKLQNLCISFYQMILSLSLISGWTF